MSKKQMIYNFIENKEMLIKEINEKTWEYSELGFQEYKSVELYEKLLKQEGFHVEKGIAGMPTAFEATFGEGQPVIGITAEYDALPNLSQQAGIATRKPIEEGASGQACGHNSLGAASLGAAVALKDYLKETGIKGTVKLFGCPSEEKGNGKTYMARDGYFDSLDAAFTWHPMDKNEAWSISSLANISVIFNFKGITSHAAATPHLGRSALDSAEIMSVGVNYLREHIIPEARVHYAYLDAGGTAPNVVQGTASVLYYVRAPKVLQVLPIIERLKDIAKGSALISDTQYNYEIQTGMSNYLPNKVLTEIVHQSMEEFVAPEFDDKDFELAKKFSDTLSDEERAITDKYIVDKFGRENFEQVLKRPLDTRVTPLKFQDHAMPGSTDVGDLSHVVPTAQFTVATGALGTSIHSWQMTAQGNTSIAIKGTKYAAKVMALSAVRVLENPEILEKAKQELDLETGGKYVCPIPDDLEPRL